MESCQKVPKFDFQSQFSMSKIIGIFLNFFFHWRISIKEHICCYWDFLIKSLFKAVYFLITTNQMFLVMKPNNQFDNGWVISAAFNVRILHTILNNLLFICFFWQKGHYQIENTLRDSLQKLITLYKARSVYLWGWCKTLVEIEVLPQGCPYGVTIMPKNLKKVQMYPNPVITLLE